MKIKKKRFNFIWRSLSALLCLTVVSVGCFAVFSGIFVFGYAFIVDGNYVGFSPSIQAYHSVLEEVNTEIVSDFGEEAAIHKDADMVVKVIKQNDITTEKEFRDNVAALSEHMRYAYTLMVDGRASVSFSTEQAFHDALTAYTAMYEQEGGTVSLAESVECVPQYVSEAGILTVEEAVEYLKNQDILHVRCVVETQYSESVAYSEKIEEDSAMYEGETNITQAGENGEKLVRVKISYINGVETDREIIGEQITKEAAEQICRIGTKVHPTGVGSGTFLFPTAGIISSAFGERWNRQHKGIDIANSEGTDIKASDEGTVSFAGVQNGYGNIIILDHKNGYLTYYGHCSELLKQKGDIVEKGEVIAKMGNTGNSTGPHVHFEIRKDGEVQNPLDYVPQNP